MLKRKIDSYLKNWFESRNTALLIKGARQIGKTTSIDNFIDSTSCNSIRINFAYEPELIDMFVSFEKYNEVLLRLSTLPKVNLDDKNTIIFFDEIQLLYIRRAELIESGKISATSLDLISCLKPLVKENKYRYILSGSLLGTELKNVLLTPTGSMDEIQMFPLDFEEYLWAKDISDASINYLKDCFEKEIPVDDYINKMFLSYFKEYVLVGGLPESVDSFIKYNDLSKVELIHHNIIKRYNEDIVKYINNEEKKMKVREMYASLASEINSKNKRYMLTHVFKEQLLRKDRSLIEEYLWLKNSGIAIPVYNVTEPISPLTFSLDRKTLKLFSNDIGLLTTQLIDTGLRRKILMDEKEVNFGAPYENAVAQELASHGYIDKLYYYNSKKHGEIDFLIEKNGESIPLEIKSGKPNQMNTYNHMALNKIIDIYKIPKSYVFGNSNIVNESENIVQLPLYMVMFL